MTEERILKQAPPIPVEKLLGRSIKDEWGLLRSPHLAEREIHPFVTEHPDGRKVYTAFVDQALTNHSLLNLLSAVSPEPDFGNSIGMVVGDWMPMHFKVSSYDKLRHMHEQTQPHWGDFVDVHAGYFIDALGTQPSGVLGSIMGYPERMGIQRLLAEPLCEANEDVYTYWEQIGIHLERIDHETLKINYRGKAQGIFKNIYIDRSGWGSHSVPEKWETAVSLLPVIQIEVAPAGQRQFKLDLLEDPELIEVGRRMLDPNGLPEYLQNPVGRLNPFLGFLTVLYYSRDLIHADKSDWEPKQHIVEHGNNTDTKQGGMAIGPAQIPVAALRRRHKVLEKAEIIPALVEYTDTNASGWLKVC